MSETPEPNNGDAKSPDAEQSSIEWLELLAGEPDAIWGMPAESDSKQQQDAEKDAFEGRSQTAAHLDPTAESPKPTKEQMQSLVRALEEDDEGIVSAGFVDEKADDPVGWASVLQAKKPPKEASASGVIEPGGEGQPENSTGQAVQGIADYSEELLLENDDLLWLDDMEKMPEMKRNPYGDDEDLSANEPGNVASGDSAKEVLRDAIPESLLDANLDEVPDDPDEAIAWLERLAAKQGAPAEELPTVKTVTPNMDAAPESGAGKFSLGEMDAGEIPEDPDEAMAWLEMLAAKEVANTGEGASPPSGDLELPVPSDAEPAPDVEPTVEALSADLDEALGGSLPSGLDEALDWLEELTIEPGEAVTTPAEPLAVVEEPPTPAVAHQVDEALAGAELLFAEPDTREPGAEADQPADELQYDEAEDAMAWLEQLAARQGAPIEELTTVDIELEEVAPDEGVVEELAGEIPGLEDDVSEETVAELELEVAEEPESESEEAVIAAADETLVVPDVLARDAVLEVAETADMTVVEPVDVVHDVAEQDLERRMTVEEDKLEMALEPEAPEEDLAWLETLGAVDAQKWLEAEAAGSKEEAVAVSEPAADEGQAGDDGVLPEEPTVLFGISPKGPGSEALAEARQEMEDGHFDTSLTKYAALVEDGQFLAFLIDDLEAVSDQRGPEPGLQRVLGDAYARNGQLRKALESYREALANL
jgi:tetratricopeptide (TPR) repeat protein